MVLVGASATFTATAIGTPPISYQWNRNGLPIGGATSATYTTPPTSSADNGASFTITVTNSVNSFTSPAATLTVTSTPRAPAIVAGPQNLLAGQGYPASFYVFATGTAPLSYQWSKNGTPINGATNAKYTTPATVSADDKSQFTVTISNSAGTVTSGPATLFIQAPGGLSGFQLPGPGYPGTPTDLIGVQFRLQVVANTSQAGRIIFGGNVLYTPGSTIGGYDTQFNVYSSTWTYTNGGCTAYPPLGTRTEGNASLGIATADYPYAGGATSAVASGITTSDPVNWPVQTYLIDNIPKLYESETVGQLNINGLEALVTVRRGGTLTDTSGFERCGIPMLETTYRIWTVTTQIGDDPTVVNQIIVPDAASQYIAPYAAMQFLTEFEDNPGTFAVQYWDFAYMCESNPVWTPASILMTNDEYTGSGQNLGVHVVSVNGQDRVEISNVPGNQYLPGNLPFAIAPSTGTPYYFTHIALGGGWQTTLTYVNYSRSRVTCTTSFFSDSGAPLAVSFGAVSSSTRTDTLGPGATLHQQSSADLSGPVVTGWAEAQCTAPVKASLLFRLYSQGTAQSEAGVNAMTAPATKFVSFAETRTGIAYANPSISDAATVTITALNSTGQTLASTSVVLQPGQHAAANIGPLLHLNRFSGSVQITSTRPIISLSLNFEAFPAFSSLPAGELSSALTGASTYYFSHLALGGGWQTTITYVNYSAQSVTCQTSFFSDSGTPLPVFFGGAPATSRIDTIGPNASLHQESTADLNAAVATGWAQTQCNGPLKASLLFRLYSQGRAVSEAAVSATAAPASKFVTFAQTRTGVAYANPSSIRAATVTIAALDSTGRTLASTNFVLQPGQHAAANIGPLLNLSGFSGSIQIASTQPIITLSLNFEAFPAFSSLPPGDLDSSTLLATGE